MQMTNQLYKLTEAHYRSNTTHYSYYHKISINVLALYHEIQCQASVHTHAIVCPTDLIITSLASKTDAVYMYIISYCLYSMCAST